MMDNCEKRSTDRVTTAIRLLVSGQDSSGSFFLEETRTVVVSLHGARIIIKQLIGPNTEVLVRNIATGDEADMQIIGQVAAQPEGYHYALRFLGATDNFWGIDFPPVSEAEAAAGRVLLVCANCHTSAVVCLNEFELEVFESHGAITFPCKKCRNQTSWTSPNQERVIPSVPASPPVVNEPEPAPAPPKADGRERRRDKRLPLNMKACIRTDRFGEEEVVTENVSKNGFAFNSFHKYPVSMVLEVSLPFAHGAGNIFSPAKIACFRPLYAEGCFAYGVCYLRDSKPHSDSPREVFPKSKAA